MTFRIIKDENLIGIIKTDNMSETLKSLKFCKDNQMSIELNVLDIADTYKNEEYEILDITIVAPKVGGETLPYIAVYVD